MNSLEPQAKISIDNILFATDFSPAMEVVFPYAAAIADRYHSRLFVAHVINTESFDLVESESARILIKKAHDEAEQKITQLLAPLRLERERYQVVVAEGVIPEVLVDIIQWNHIDLAVLGTHGRRAFKKLLLGSVAEEVFRMAPCPVLTVGPKTAPVPARGELRHILYPLEFFPDMSKAALFVVSLAERYGARLTVMNVSEDMPVSANTAEEFPPTVRPLDKRPCPGALRSAETHSLREGIWSGNERHSGFCREISRGHDRDVCPRTGSGHRVTPPSIGWLPRLGQPCTLSRAHHSVTVAMQVLCRQGIVLGRLRRRLLRDRLFRNMAKKKPGSAKKSASRNKANKKGVRKTKVTLPARRSKQKKRTTKKVRRAVKKSPSSQPASKEIRSPERSTLGGGTFSVGERRSRNGRRSASAGQAGDLQGVSRKQAVDSESVEELLEEGQTYEAEAISGVEDALEPDQGEVQTREVPEDDVPEEYTEKD